MTENTRQAKPKELADRSPGMTAFAERLPDEQEREIAAQLEAILGGLLAKDGTITLKVGSDDGESGEVTLVTALAESLLQVFQILSRGYGFQVTPVRTRLTERQAADFLNVPQPYLLRLLERGEIPCAMHGRHRSIMAKDLFSYKAGRDAVRAAALTKLANLGA